MAETGRQRAVTSTPNAGDAVEANADPGAAWRRIDLHIHTPASSDYLQSGVSILDILRRAEERGLDAIALTDHNSVRGYADLWREIEDLELLEFLNRMTPAEADRLAEFRRLLSHVLVLPGFEFTAQFGFHILAIFPEGTSVRLMEHLLLLLGIPEDRFGSGEVGATTDVLRAYEILGDHGALVIGAHVNSAHGIAMQGLRFGGQTKIAYTQHPHLAALEVTDLLPASNRRSTARFFSGAKTEYPRRMHCIQGSDAHRLDRDPDRDVNLGVGDRPTEVLLPELSFRALKELFASAEFERTRPHTPPPTDPIKAARIDGNTMHQAFHESVANKRAQSAILRDIVAFANASGGRIFLGLSATEKRPIAGVEAPNTVKAELAAELAAQITPALTVGIEEVASDGKAVIVIDVPGGSEKPYALAPGGIFVRKGAESMPASRDEIVLMVTGGLASSAVPLPEPQAAKTNGKSSPSPARGSTPPEKRNQSPSVRSNASHPQRSEPRSAPLENQLDGSIKGRAKAEAQLESYEEDVSPDPIAPTTGVEVLDAFEQDGITYYTLRDLRNHKVIYNVTKTTDRRLWRAAIAQREKGQPDEASVRWNGDFGLWRSYRQRTGERERRYDLIYRGDGDPRVFYGVSEAGMHSRWQDLLAATAVAG